MLSKTNMKIVDDKIYTIPNVRKNCREQSQYFTDENRLPEMLRSVY